MSHKWAPNTWVKISRAFHLCQTHARKSAASLPLCGTSHCRVHVQQPYCYKVGYLSWRHIHHLRITGRKGWLCKANQVRQRLGLHTSTLNLNTSASRWSAGLSQHMLRVRNTLDTVSKAVSGRHTELLSKIARLKPNALKGVTKAEASVESAPKAEQSDVTLTPAPINAAPTSTSTTPKPICKSSPASPSIPTSAATFDASAATSTHPHNSDKANVTGTILTVPKEKRVIRVVPAVKASPARKQEELKLSPGETEINRATSKQSIALFHPSAFSVNLDDTYNYLAHHINTYFGSSTNTQDKKRDNVDISSASSQGRQTRDLIPVFDKPAYAATVIPPPKKGLGHYLSYSAPTVQAFVGSYIAPLVPRFRAADSKSAAVEVKKSEEAPVKQVEATVSKEKKSAEEKANKLLLQRRRVSVDNRTRGLVQALRRASDVRVYINRVEDLSYHLLEFPDTSGVAVKERVIPCLLRLKQASDPGLRAAVREALALVGYHKPVKGRGIRILSIDGGGLRRYISWKLTGKPIYKLFDYICGVSTGAILGFMLGVFQIPLNECDDLYRKLGSDVFKQNVIVGTVKMGWNHAFYDSEAWENILREKMGSHLLVETSRNPECPKAYVFRNYNLLPGLRSHYLGGCQHQLWQAIRASSAAPGYFQEFTLGNDLHQVSVTHNCNRVVDRDGGLLINNPTALAIHESKCLWPNTPLECVVSLGTGRAFDTPGKGTTSTSLKTKLNNIISSATDTEEVHVMLDAFLPNGTYFRFNPYMSEDISMDENRQEKLNLLQAEGLRYLERNEEKLKKVARILTREKGSVQKMTEWAQLRADMYNGVSFKSSKV
ncbi:hypothetical protein F7725_023120 [Dissostichus mawsoni]|uniref:PNPLA domain-containing protein n=1 Tax=Dissostichus mawsoni TaxID=36200 RepID=A0A7J5YZT7_DISMA|nr:hypothetical protein F7725_023120 [Dissostichus mawsoni]